MPFALVVIGLIMIVSGARNTHAALGKQLVSDFTGPGNFTYWLISVGVVGSLGYIEPLKPLSRAFMALILISFILKNGGVFDKFQEALASGPVSPEKGITAASATGGTLGFNPRADQSGKFVQSVSDTVQAQIASNTANAGQAQKNFGSVVKAATTAAKMYFGAP